MLNVLVAIVAAWLGLLLLVNWPRTVLAAVLFVSFVAGLQTIAALSAVALLVVILGAAESRRSDERSAAEARATLAGNSAYSKAINAGASRDEAIAAHRAAVAAHRETERVARVRSTEIANSTVVSVG